MAKEQAIQYIKTGGGSFVLNLDNGKQRMIKSGQKFQAKPSQIPEAFRDTIKAVNPQEEKEVEEQIVSEVAKPLFTLKHRGGGKYNVEDEGGKVMNDDFLTKAEAEALVNSLT